MGSSCHRVLIVLVLGPAGFVKDSQCALQLTANNASKAGRKRSSEAWLPFRGFEVSALQTELPKGKGSMLLLSEPMEKCLEPAKDCAFHPTPR